MVLPLLLVLVMGLIDFGRAYQSVITMTNAAREGARLGAIGATEASIQSRVVSTSGVPISTGNVTVTYPGSGASGTSVRVQVAYTFPMLTPIGGLLRLFGTNTVGNSLNLTSSADMRIE